VVASQTAFTGKKSPLLVKWCGNTSAFHMWLKCPGSRLGILYAIQLSDRVYNVTFPA
jgi:hypothetical protein